MPINTKKKLLFIHIPKCSGVYITKLFGMYANNFLHSTNNKEMKNKDCHIYGRTLQHYTIEMVNDVINTYNIMNTEKKVINLKKYKIFAIVRNPYTRFISAYTQYPKKCNQKFKELINKRDILTFALDLQKKIENEGYSFFKYGAYHQFQPMTDYIDNNLNLDIEIIKMDDKEYQTKVIDMCKTYKFKYNNIVQNKNANNTNYSSYMKNKKLIECINEIYKKDFIKFNYAMIKP